MSCSTSQLSLGGIKIKISMLFYFLLFYLSNSTLLSCNFIFFKRRNFPTFGINKSDFNSSCVIITVSHYVIIHSYLILTWCREPLASWRTQTTPNQTFRCLMRTLIPLTAVCLSRMLLLTQDAALVVNCAKTIFHLGESRWCCVAVFWDSCPSLFTSSSRRGEASRLQREAWSLHAHTDSPSMHSVSLVSARAADRTADAQIALITADYSR